MWRRIRSVWRNWKVIGVRFRVCVRLWMSICGRFRCSIRFWSVSIVKLSVLLRIISRRR